MNRFPLNLASLKVVLHRKGLKYEDLLRLSSLSKFRLAALLKQPTLLEEELESLAQALEVPAEVLTDTTGHALEILDMAEQTASRNGFDDAPRFLRYVLDRKYAARMVEGKKISPLDVDEMFKDFS